MHTHAGETSGAHTEHASIVYYTHKSAYVSPGRGLACALALRTYTHRESLRKYEEQTHTKTKEILRKCQGQTHRALLRTKTHKD